MLHHLFTKGNNYLGSSSMELCLYMSGFFLLFCFYCKLLVLLEGGREACASTRVTTGSGTFLLIFFFEEVSLKGEEELERAALNRR